MTNFLQNNWRTEYDRDPYLIKLLGKYNGIRGTYQHHLDAYGDAEDGFSVESDEEIWLEDKVPEYNSALVDIETDFTNYVMENYGHHPV